MVEKHRDVQREVRKVRLRREFIREWEDCKVRFFPTWAMEKVEFIDSENPFELMVRFRRKVMPGDVFFDLSNEEEDIRIDSEYGDEE